MSYFSEAFKAMNLLEEEAFNLSNNQEDIDAIKDFKDNDVLDGQIDVIDPDAESEEELEDSYIGKAVIECVVCHQKIYKNKDELNIDDESGLVNVDEECPYCYSADGFQIVGQIEPYKEFDDIEEPIVKVDGEEVEFDEGGKAEIEVEPNEDGEISVELVAPEAEEVEVEDELDVEPILDDAEEEEEDAEDEDEDDDEKNESLDESLIGGITGSDRALDTVDNAVNNVGNVANTLVGKDSVLGGENGGAIVSTVGSLLADAESEAEEMNEGKCPDCGKETCECEELEEGVHDSESKAQDQLDLYCKEVGAPVGSLKVSMSKEDLKDFEDEYGKLDAAIRNRIFMLTEGFEHVNVETADSTLDMTQEENGKVVITSEPKEPHETGEEVIAPYDLDDAADVIEDGEDEALGDEDFDFDAEADMGAEEGADNFDSEAAEENEFAGLSDEDFDLGEEPVGEEAPEEEEEKNESFHEAFEGSATRCIKGTETSNESFSEPAFPESGKDYEETKKWEKDTDPENYKDRPFENTNESCEGEECNEGKCNEEDEECNEGILGAALGAIGSFAAAHPVATALGAGALGGLAGSALSRNESVEEVKLEDFNEGKFNEIAESYLKDVYENVNSFNTTNCYEDTMNESLIIEGTIGFNSGSSRDVKFTFNPKYSKNNKYYFEGVCSQLVESKDVPFKMAATINEGVVTPRALKYHYTINECLVNGTVIK